MPLERSEVEHLAALARIRLTADELEKFQEQISNILEQFQILEEVDTTNVPATGHAGAGADNAVGPHGAGVLREDVSEASSPAEDILSNAPRREGDFFRVKVVLEE